MYTSDRLRSSERIVSRKGAGGALEAALARCMLSRARASWRPGKSCPTLVNDTISGRPNVKNRIALENKCRECQRGHRLDQRIAVRLAQADVAAIAARIEGAGTSLSTFVRGAIRRELGREPGGNTVGGASV